MSGGSGSPNYMRQRHSQGYVSSGDDIDIEDDACSRPFSLSPPLPATRKWGEVLENFIWIASAVFIVYFGDTHSNFIYLLWHDDRIRRLPLYFGMLGVGLNVLFFVYTSLPSMGFPKFSEEWEISSTPVLPLVTLLGLVSFCLFCLALWPIWSFLTFPLVFTLFMACTVILPYLVLGTIKPQNDLFRID